MIAAPVCRSVCDWLFLYTFVKLLSHVKMQQREDSRASSVSRRDAFSSLVPPLSFTSVIIHSRVLLYGSAFGEMLHCAPVYELMTPLCPPGNLQLRLICR